MSAFKKIVGGLVMALAMMDGLVSAVPHALPEMRITPARDLWGQGIQKRQAAPGALSDVDILQFALTLEHLEAAFYKDGFAKFGAPDFQALGFSQKTIDDLIQIGKTEATHVTVLSGAISGAGGKPVAPCEYDFGFTDAASMVATAKVLEAVGVSAYLGAAPLISDPKILAAAASIVTIESRHNTLIRAVGQDIGIPQAFDVAIPARQVFTLAAQFIKSCPEGSNLPFTAFPSLVINNPETVQGGSALTLRDESLVQAAGGPLFCAFQSGESGIQFAELTGGKCTVPSGLKGEVFVTISSDGIAISDEKTVAGPSILVLS